jgi:hypothetical protein
MKTMKMPIARLTQPMDTAEFLGSIAAWRPAPPTGVGTTNRPARRHSSPVTKTVEIQAI